MRYLFRYLPTYRYLTYDLGGGLDGNRQTQTRQRQTETETDGDRDRNRDRSRQRQKQKQKNRYQIINPKKKSTVAREAMIECILYLTSSLLTQFFSLPAFAFSFR